METDVHQRSGGNRSHLPRTLQASALPRTATHFYEWTGPKGDKVMWRFTKAGSDVFCYAGLWDRADTADGTVESLTIMTCAPGPDFEPYHNRQPVILGPDQWEPWLDLTADAALIMRAGAANTIAIDQVAEVRRALPNQTVAIPCRNLDLNVAR